MIRYALAAALVSAQFLGQGPGQPATTRVVVHVAVEDATGRQTALLPAAAFALSVDGQPHAVESIAPASDPLAVRVLVDASRSMAKRESQLDRPVGRFVRTLRDGDRIRSGVIDDGIAFAPAFASVPSSFRLRPSDPIKLKEFPSGGGTPLWDGIHHAVSLLAAERGRRILLVFSDGRASGNHFSLQEAAEFAGDTKVAVVALAPSIALGIRQASKEIAVVTPAAHLDRLTQFTGGLLIGGYDSKVDPLEQLPGLRDRLRAGYRLTFDVPADRRRHRLSIAVKAPGVTVRAPLTFRAVPE